jgi:hypothetical protein
VGPLGWQQGLDGIPDLIGNELLHVIPGLDEQAAETVARLILGDGEVIADLSANKPLATGPGTD